MTWLRWTSGRLECAESWKSLQALEYKDAVRKEMRISAHNDLGKVKALINEG